MVAAYGLILPPPVLTAPRLGCLNVHASLLPRWRGAAPIQRALLAGDRETGITIMQMEEGLDTGPILLQQTVPIASRATAAGLSAELAALGGRLILAALDGVAAGRLSSRPQPREGVTYAPKLSRDEAGSTGACLRPLWSARFGPSIRGRALFSKSAVSGSGYIAAMICRAGGGMPGTGSTTACDRLRRGRAAAAAAAAGRPRRAGSAGLSAWLSDSRPGRSCRAPLQADYRI